VDGVAVRLTDSLLGESLGVDGVHFLGTHHRTGQGRELTPRHGGQDRKPSQIMHPRGALVVHGGPRGGDRWSGPSRRAGGRAPPAVVFDWLTTFVKVKKSPALLSPPSFKNRAEIIFFHQITSNY
jgi:hypothetical protein